MTVIINDNWHAGRNRRATNTSDDCVPVSSSRTDADDIVIIRNADVANIDIVTARGQI